MFHLTFPYTSKWHLYTLRLETEEWVLTCFPFFGLDYIFIPLDVISQPWGFFLPLSSFSYSINSTEKSYLQAH